MKKPASAIFAAAAAVALVGCASSGGYQGNGPLDGQEEGLFGKINGFLGEAKSWIFGRSTPQYVGSRTWAIDGMNVRLMEKSCVVSNELGRAEQSEGMVSFVLERNPRDSIIATETGISVVTRGKAATLPRVPKTEELYGRIMRQYANTMNICERTRILERRGDLPTGTTPVASPNY